MVISTGTAGWQRQVQCLLISAAIILFCARAIDIGRVYNHTFDEPTQIGSGLEIWQYGTFVLHSDVPPLAKRLIAAPAYLAGVRFDSPPARGDWQAANRILYDSGRYWFVLRSARAINTAIGGLLILALAAFAWTTFGPWAGVVSAWVAGVSPGLLAAASTANSDILGVLTVISCFFAFRRLLLTGTRGAAVLFALAVAAALATKLSAVPFLMFGLPVTAAFTVGRQALDHLRRPVPLFRHAARLTMVCVLVVPTFIWATYGFRSASPIGDQEAVRLAESMPSGNAQHLGPWIARLSTTPVPLGGFVRGVGVGYKISKSGHPAYLMGNLSLHGWPYYFLVTLLLKVPLGILGAVLLAAALALSQWRKPSAQIALLLLALGAAVLLSVAGAGINVGHRHIVGIEALFALIVAGGVSLAAAPETRRLRQASAVALVAFVVAGGVASLRAQPDALGYTNALAGSEPDWWLIDSNLDWGQDLERLRDELAARNVNDNVYLSYFGTADPSRHGIGALPLRAGDRPCGWIAISVSHLRGLSGAAIGHLAPENERFGYRWLLAENPVAKVGTSIRLYHVPAPGSRRWGHCDATPNRMPAISGNPTPSPRF